MLGKDCCSFTPVFVGEQATLVTLVIRAWWSIKVAIKTSRAEIGSERGGDRSWASWCLPRLLISVMYCWMLMDGSDIWKPAGGRQNGQRCRCQFSRSGKRGWADRRRRRSRRSSGGSSRLCWSSRASPGWPVANHWKYQKNEKLTPGCLGPSFTLRAVGSTEAPQPSSHEEPLVQTPHSRSSCAKIGVWKRSFAIWNLDLFETSLQEVKAKQEEVNCLQVQAWQPSSGFSLLVF